MNNDNEELLGSDLVDYFIPERGAGGSPEEFSAQAQRDQFLGGVSTEEKKNTTTNAIDSRLSQFSAKVDDLLASWAVGSGSLLTGISAAAFAYGDMRDAIGTALIGVGSIALGALKWQENDESRANKGGQR